MSNDVEGVFCCWGLMSMYSELDSPLEDRLVFDKSLFDGEDIAKQMGD